MPAGKKICVLGAGSTGFDDKKQETLDGGGRWRRRVVMFVW